jgi:exodeoxyribonuclease V alpha subunit
MAGVSDRASVQGVVERLRFGPTDDGFAVAVLDCDGVREVVAGTLGRIAVGDTLRVEGTRETSKYGQQIKATKVMPVAAQTVDGVARFLATLPGFGDVLARRLVERYGKDAIEVLMADPAKVASDVGGITKSKAEAAAEKAREKRDEMEVLVWLYGIGLTPAFAGRVLKEWGARAPSIIRENPYRLARDIDRIGFALADQIARNLGIAEDALERREAAILHVLAQASESGADVMIGGRKQSTGGGHCFLPRSTLLNATALLLSLSPASINEAVETLVEAEAVVVDGDAIYSAKLHTAEFKVSEKIGVLLRHRREQPEAPKPGSAAARALEPLTDEQRRAVATVGEAGVAVITGGPGTGKTTVLKAVVAAWEGAKRIVLLCAPTGRAAKRLSESTGRPAGTIHRLLEWKGDQGFQRNEKMPLVGDLIVIDEASMLDVQLARALLAAVPQGASVLLVGDVDQLPSVGPGQVLHDVIASGAVPVARLSRIFRQAEGSRISEAAAGVLRGEAPSGRDDEELHVVPVWAPDDDTPGGPIAQREIVRLVTETMPARGFPPRDVQVLTPMHKGEAGTVELNRALQAALNPVGAEFPRGRSAPLRVGDPVQQRRNNYDLGVMNGDLGRIVAIDPSVPSITSMFGDDEVVHEKESINELELAYACSIHKSQGSEYPAVVIALLNEHFIMLRRNLLYTAITRGKRRVVIVGASRALSIAARTKDTSTRNTGLRAKLAKVDRTPAPRPVRPSFAPSTTAATPPAPVPVPSRAPEAQLAAARRAVQILAGMCDGAASLDDRGFNRVHAEEGRNLAEMQRAFTDREFGRARYFATFYKRQLPAEVLSALGIGGNG